MKTATVKELKAALRHLSHGDLMEVCLKLSKFKKENKELLTYLLFEAHDEAAYIEKIKQEMDDLFEEVNTKSFYYIKKSIRKILRTIKKYIRYSKKKETEVEVLLYFCQKLNQFQPSIDRNTQLTNLYHRQIAFIEKKLLHLHEDLQYDYGVELDALSS